MALKPCPFCGGNLPEHSQSCVHCGRSLQISSQTEEWPDWLLKLNSLLTSERSPISISQLSKTELRSAFDDGLTPEEFANSPRIFVQKENPEPVATPVPRQSYEWSKAPPYSWKQPQERPDWWSWRFVIIATGIMLAVMTITGIIGIVQTQRLQQEIIQRSNR